MFSKLTRVSPAMGVAMIALVLSLGGTSFAQGAASKLGKLISGSKIKRGSIPGDRLVKGGVPGDRIKSNSITGKQINEKTLGTVPSATRAQRVTLADRATNAQRATNADNALALGGTAAAGYLSFASRGIPSGTTVTGAFGIGSNVTATVTTTVVDPEDLTPLTPPTATSTTAMTSDIRQVVQLPGIGTRGSQQRNGELRGRRSRRRSLVQRNRHRPDRPRGQGLPVSLERRGHRHGRRRPGDPRARGQPQRLRRACDERHPRRDRRVRYVGVHRTVI